jgi:hypothetical protein
MCDEQYDYDTAPITARSAMREKARELAELAAKSNVPITKRNYALDKVVLDVYLRGSKLMDKRNVDPEPSFRSFRG